MHKSDTATIISSLRILSRDIESDDGVANMAIAEAADRMEEMQTMINSLSGTIGKLQDEIVELQDEIGWIQDLATMSNMEGEDSAEVRLNKIKMCTDDLLSPSSHE